MNAKCNRILLECFNTGFIFLFIYTAFYKLADFQIFKQFIYDSFGHNSFSSIISFSIPLIEIGIAIFLFIPKKRLFGLYSCLAILIVFTAYLFYMSFFVSNRPCKCGGAISKLTWNQHIVLNTFLMLMAWIAIIIFRKHKQAIMPAPT